MDKKIKLVFVIILTLIIFCSTVAYAKVVQDGETVQLYDSLSFYNKHSFVRCTKEWAYGIGGMGEDNDCIKINGGYVTGHGNWYTQVKWDNANAAKYLVVEFDILLSDKTTGVYLATGGHTAVTDTIDVSGMGLNDVWGKLVAVFDLEQATSNLYYNDVPVAFNYASCLGDGESNHNYIRIVVSGENDSLAYIDNFKMYEAQQSPDVQATPSVLGHESDFVLNTELNQSFNDCCEVSDSETQITIYKDTTYTEIIDANTVLSSGAVIMLTSSNGMRTYIVDVDDGILLENFNDDGTIPVAKGITEVVYGAFGKDESDASQKIISESTLPCFTSYTWLNDEYEGIIRADFNIEPGNMTEIYIGTNVNMPVSDKLTLYANRWNRVSVVYDTASYNKTTGKGTAVTYVNGVKVSETDTIFAHMAQLRIIMTGEAGSYAYADDFSLTQFAKTDAQILTLPQLDPNIALDEGIIVKEGITAGEIVANTPSDTVRVYTDSFYTDLLTGSDSVDFGNIAVVQSKDFVYSYYPIYGEIVTDEVINIIQNVSKFQFSGGTVSSIYEVGGKDETDASFKVELTGGNYASYTYNWTNDSFEGYVVTELNIFPQTASIAIWTGNYASYAPEITGLNQNQWNKITVVYDTGSFDGSKYTTDLYVNGVYTSSIKTDAKSGDNLMLFVTGSKGQYIYLDDFKVYETNSMPVITTPDVSKYYYSSDNQIVFDGDVTPLTLSAGGLTLKAFYDDTYTEPVGEKAVIPVGAIIVAYDKYNNFRYFTVADSFRKTIVASGDGGVINNFRFADMSYTAVNAIHGRESGDYSYKLTITSDLSTPNGYFNFDYTNPGTDRYLVFEASVYSEADCSVKMGTRYHNSLSGEYSSSSGKYQKNQWNRVVYILDRQNTVGYLYINGTLCSTTSNAVLTSDILRFVIFAAKDSVHYMDDIVVYESPIKPNPTSAAVIPSSMYYLVYGSQLYMTDDTDMSNLRAMFGVDDSYDVKLVKDGSATDITYGGLMPDNSAVVIKKDDVLTVYDVSVVQNNNTIMYGTANNSGVLTSGTLTVAVPVDNVSGAPDVGIAKYKDGELVSIEVAQSTSGGRFVKCDISVNTTTVDTIKVFVWNNKYIPLSKNGFITNK